jgi:hypothetical protein
MQIQSAVSELTRELMTWGPLGLSLVPEVGLLDFIFELPSACNLSIDRAMHERPAWLSGIMVFGREFQITSEGRRPRLHFQVLAQGT